MKTIKMLITLILVLLMTMSLCACGKTAEPNGTAVVVEVPGEVTETRSPVEIAESMVGEPASALIDLIGEPVYTDYAPSCLGPGEDGELGYDGFTVYTYREGDTESIEEIVRAK